jgi:large subunit ribosomal protein L9
MVGMKIILRSDVENLGRLGDVVVVRPGYGRNFLLPQGLAMSATKSNLKVFELERKKLQAKMDALRAAAGDLAGRIEAVVLSITMRVGENDKLYGSVTSTMIAAELAAKGVEVDRHRILLDSPIRTLGDFEVRVRLHADVTAKLAVKVVPEERVHEEDAKSAKQTVSANEQSLEQAAEAAE